ncbi:acetylajmalan esterase isoform X4 [Spinacia oleracea]|uniref:Acetylajmalan esterase isoform X4 n=1 Tax=Spinacia oleracea TaxID=3562 RepID=A0ABM3R9W9_SPIOL|nr:acetylajmalan esterase-like isoform X4 [Spinacia oleracea]
MVARVSIILPLSLVVALILCFATVALSSTFTDDNPIRVVSDGPHDFQSSDVFTNIVDIHDDDDDDDDAPILPRSNIKAIYQFGDSISDTGNLIHENPTFKYARLPYGISFFQIPTGRPSNGLLMIDYFTKYLKMPFLDPYLKKDGNFSHGVNFAVAGAAALNTSILAMKDIVTSNVTNSSLLVQLDWFKSHLNSICSTASECKEKLGKSLIMMGEIGGNDYNSVLFGKTSMLKAYDLVPEVVQVIKYVIKEVIKLGAIRIVVPGFDKDATMKVCCGVGENEYNFDMNRQCGSDGVVACEHPNQRIFWDGIHLTQHAYRIMANWLIKYNFDPIFSMT